MLNTRIDANETVAVRHGDRTRVKVLEINLQKLIPASQQRAELIKQPRLRTDYGRLCVLTNPSQLQRRELGIYLTNDRDKGCHLACS